MFPDTSGSRWELRFVLFGIPVRVQPWFWLVTIVFAVQGGFDTPMMLVWVGAVFFSILLHEMGHALVIRQHGWEPTITLHGFGGYAAYQPTRLTPASQVAIAAAGPLAGFLLAAALLLVLRVADVEAPLLGFNLGGDERLANRNLRLLVAFLLYINVFWGLVNLLPVYPLDGSRIVEGLLRQTNPRDAMRQSLWVSTVAGAIAAVLFALRMGDGGSIYPVIFFGYLAYASYQALEASGWR